MVELTLDAGVLIAADRNDHRAWHLKKRALAKNIQLVVPTTVVAQAWRGPRSANLARFLRGCRVVPLTDALARATGDLCAQTRTHDIVDASVVVTAGPRGTVLTADPKDLRPLAARARLTVRQF